MEETLKRWIDLKSRDLDPDSRADRVLKLCFRYGLYATRVKDGERVLVGTLGRYLGSVDVGDDWDRIEQEVLAMSIMEIWD